MNKCRRESKTSQTGSEIYFTLNVMLLTPLKGRKVHLKVTGRSKGLCNVLGGLG